MADDSDPVARAANVKLEPVATVRQTEFERSECVFRNLLRGPGAAVAK
jgi:hypothetical protein